MKKSLLGSFLLFLALFAQAQDARTVFINMPDSLMPLLTKVNREDCIDFLDSKMRAQVKNANLQNNLWYQRRTAAKYSA